MITLNITIGGNLLIELNKNSKQDLKELIDKAANTDLILYDLLESANLIGNNWHTTQAVLSELPLVAYGAIYSEDEEVDVAIDYEKCWGFLEYQTHSFAEILLRDKRVIFKKV
jgi:hypothetical protein